MKLGFDVGAGGLAALVLYAGRGKPRPYKGRERPLGGASPAGTKAGNCTRARPNSCTHHCSSGREPCRAARFAISGNVDAGFTRKRRASSPRRHQAGGSALSATGSRADSCARNAGDPGTGGEHRATDESDAAPGGSGNSRCEGASAAGWDSIRIPLSVTPATKSVEVRLAEARKGSSFSKLS